jgi:hypothetical protein
MAILNRSGELSGEYMIAPPDQGHGYVGMLEVFHQLHCLVRAIYQIHPTIPADYISELYPSVHVVSYG